jgi:hypothetical protein
VRVLITGSRDWNCYPMAMGVVTRLKVEYGNSLVIVHGDCPTGVDASFKQAAICSDVEQEPHPALWGKHGAAAGPIRNSEMVAAGAGLCLAFTPDIERSRGTRDCYTKAKAAGIPTWLICHESKVGGVLDNLPPLDSTRPPAPAGTDAARE